MATRLAIFSDIHANLPAMEVVRDHIAAGGFDGVYCLGDIGGYAAEPNETQALIAAMGCPVVLGNYDEGVGFNRDDCGCHYVKPFDIEVSNISFLWTRDHTTDASKAWLRGLPREIRLLVEGHGILLCHGSPRSTTEYLFESRSDGFLKQFTPGGRDDARADIIVFGHTHVPYHRVVDGVHFINTGSVGRPKDGDPRAGYCVLTLDGGTVTTEQVRLPYDVEAACQRLLAAGLPSYFAEYLRTGGKVTAPESLPEKAA
jgi:putative phosphoesterase